MFIIARGRHGRPTLQHVLGPSHTRMTLCGLDVEQWSRAYQNDAIPAVLCKRCKSMS